MNEDTEKALSEFMQDIVMRYARVEDVNLSPTLAFVPFMRVWQARWGSENRVAAHVDLDALTVTVDFNGIERTYLYYLNRPKQLLPTFDEVRTHTKSKTAFNGVSEEMHNHLVRCFKALGSACKVDLGNGPIVRGTTQIQCAGVFFGEGISFTIEGEGVVIRFGSSTQFAHVLPLRGSRFPTSADFQAVWKSAEDDRAEVRRVEFNGVSEALHTHFLRCIQAVQIAAGQHFGFHYIARGTTQVSASNALRGAVCFVVDVESESVRIVFEAAPNYSYAMALGQPFPAYAGLNEMWRTAAKEAERFAKERAPSTYSSSTLAGLVEKHRKIPSGYGWIDCDKRNDAGKFPGLGWGSNMVRSERELLDMLKEKGPGVYKIVLTESMRHYNNSPENHVRDIVEVVIPEEVVDSLSSTYSTTLAGLVERFKAIRAPNSGIISIYTHGKGRRFVCGANHVHSTAEIVANARGYGPGRYSIELEELVPVGGDEVVRHVRDIVEVVIPEYVTSETPKRTFSKVTELKVKYDGPEDRDEEDGRAQERERKADIAFSEYEKRKDALTRPLSVEYVQTILDEMLEERGFARGRLAVGQYQHFMTHVYLYDYGGCSLGSFCLKPLDSLKFTETVETWCTHKRTQRNDACTQARDVFRDKYSAEIVLFGTKLKPRSDGCVQAVQFDLFNEAEDAYERHRTDPMHLGDHREHYHEWSQRKTAEIKEHLTVDARNTLREWPMCEGVPMKIEVTEPTGTGIFIARWVKG